MELSPILRGVLRAMYRGVTISSRSGGEGLPLSIIGPREAAVYCRVWRDVEVAAALAALEREGLVHDANQAGPLNRGRHFELTTRGRGAAATLEGDEFDEDPR